MYKPFINILTSNGPEIDPWATPNNTKNDNGIISEKCLLGNRKISLSNWEIKHCISYQVCGWQGTSYE
jgi:hypothetical protein